MSAEVKKWIPGIIIALVALYAIIKLSGKSSGSQVYNALIPSGGTAPPDSRDPARTQAFSTLGSVGLAQMSLASKSEELAATIGLARDRFGYQLEALNLQNQGALERLRAELADRQYDRDLQSKALDQSFALAQSGQFGDQAGSILGALLGALGRGNQQRSQGGGGSAGSGGGGYPAQQRRTIGQMSQAAYNRLRQSALLQAIFGSPDPTGSSDPWAIFDPGAFGGFSEPGGFFDSYTPRSYDPIGSVTSSYYLENPLDFFSGGVPQFDRSLPIYQPTAEEWANWDDYYWE